MNSKVVSSLSSVDSQKQIFEIKWAGAPDAFIDIYGDKSPSRVAAYLEQKVGEQYNVIGRIIPEGYGSIMWIVGIVSDANCLWNNDYTPNYPNHCYYSQKLVAPGNYDIKIVDNKTGASGRSNNFTLVAPVNTNCTIDKDCVQLPGIGQPLNKCVNGKCVWQTFNGLTKDQVLNSNGYINGDKPFKNQIGIGGETLSNVVLGQLDGDAFIEAVAINTWCSASCGKNVVAFKLVDGKVLSVDLPDSGVGGAAQNISQLVIGSDKRIMVTETDFNGTRTNYYIVNLVDGILQATKILTSAQGGLSDVSNCGQLYFFGAETCPYCKIVAPVVEEYIKNSGCVQVIKHVVPTIFDITNDELAKKYNIQATPSFIFVDKNGCWGSISEKGGATKLEDIKNGIANFVCNGNNN